MFFIICGVSVCRIDLEPKPGLLQFPGGYGICVALQTWVGVSNG